MESIENETTKLERIMSFEMLRIISMLMIIILHFLAYSNITSNIKVFSLGYFIQTMIHSLCNVSVNCYILISGYFCLNSKFKLKKIYILCAEVWFYSICIYLGLVLIGEEPFSVTGLLYAMFPILTRQYWFVTTYVGTYILAPFVRIIIKKTNQKEHFTSILIGFFLFVVYYNFFFFCDNLNFGGATGVVWFLFLYFCGTYFAKYYKPNYKSYHLKQYLFILGFALLSRVPFYLSYIITEKEILLEGAGIFDSVYNSIFTFIASIFFFKLFLNTKIIVNGIKKKILQRLSVSSFAVYLIHDNSYIRGLLWKNVDFSNYNQGIILLLTCIVVAVCIYLFCFMIDEVRKRIFKYTFDRMEIQQLIDNKQIEIQERYDKIYREWVLMK